MEIFERHDYPGEVHYNKEVIGTTCCNSLIPVFTLQDRLNRSSYSYHKNIENTNSHLYYKPSISIVNGGSRKFEDFLAYFCYGYSSLRFRFKIGGEDNSVVVTGNSVLDEQGNILSILTFKQEFVPSTSYLDVSSIEDSRGNLNHDALVLVVSTEFTINPIYKNLYKKFYKEVVEMAIDKNVDVLLVSKDKIDEKLFKNSFKIEINNINTLNELLNDEIGNILFEEEEALLPF